jgi:hypothetical protein
MRCLSFSVTLLSVSVETPTPGLVSTPSARSAGSIKGRGSGPFAGAMTSLRSTMMTRTFAFRPQDLAQARGGGRPVRQGMDVSVERDRIVELIDAEAELGQPRHVRLEAQAAGGQH